MDRITQSLIDDFIKQYNFVSGPESDNFEKFCNYSIISKEYNDNLSIDDIDNISTGKNQGIDGIGVIINGKLIANIDEIDDLIEINKFLEVVFVFIQAKTSSKFESSEMLSFIFAVKDFFSEKPELIKTDEVIIYSDIKEHIYRNAPYMTKGKPVCKLYYITTGEWKNDRNLLAVIKAGKDELHDTNLFNDIIIEPCDANLIQKYYNKTKETVSTTFSFKDRVALPEIEGIREAYLGIIPFNEFKKIIIDDNGNLKNIFYDNVRYYLGDNKVNNEISKTLENGKFDVFSVLNNGVTIVAEDLRLVSNNFTIYNYQIVNGCQTTHVLYNHKELHNLNEITVPIKLIVTSGEEIKSKITIATNNQTEVKPEQLAALTEFQKRLEHYYKAITEPNNMLFYERLTKQYNANNSLSKERIITIQIQIKVFAAMFLNRPDLVSGYYGKVSKNLGDNIFQLDHKFEPYYTSSLTNYRLMSLFNNNSLDKTYRKAKYHMLMLSKFIINGIDMPKINSHDMINYCNRIIDVLNDPAKCLYMFIDVIKLIDQTKLDIINQKILYQKSTTDLLLSTYKKVYTGK